MAFYTKSVKQTLNDLQTTSGGLSAIESKQRLRQYGPNSIKLRTEPLWRKLLEPFLSVFMAVLVVAIGISLWHRSYFDAAIIGAIILLNALMTVPEADLQLFLNPPFHQLHFLLPV